MAKSVKSIIGRSSTNSPFTITPLFLSLATLKPPVQLRRALRPLQLPRLFYLRPPVLLLPPPVLERGERGLQRENGADTLVNVSAGAPLVYARATVPAGTWWAWPAAPMPWVFPRVASNRNFDAIDLKKRIQNCCASN